MTKYTEKVAEVHVYDWNKVGPMRQERHWEDGFMMDILPDHAWMIQVQTPEGRRFNHFYRWEFNGSRHASDRDCDIMFMKQAEAEKLAEKIRAKGEINLEHYSETYPDYCSPAGRADETEQWMAERHDAGGW